MKSIENNLTDPTSVISIPLEDTLKCKIDRIIKYVNQEYYNRIAIPDPFTCYIITDAKDNRFYIGEYLVLPNKNNIRYLMGINSEDNSKWDIYINQNDAGIYKIATYNDITIAARELNELSIRGNSNSTRCKIYNNIKDYIVDLISLDESIIGIIISLGITNDNTDLQNTIRLIDRFKQYSKNKDKYKVNEELSQLLNHYANKYPHSIYNLYNRILNTFIYNSFFKEYEGVDDFENPYNLGEAIDYILKSYYSWRIL